MNEHTPESGLEARSRELFHDSVDGLDMQVRSRLTKARHAALKAAGSRGPWFLRVGAWTPAAGLTAAALLGAALWLGLPQANHGGMNAEQPNLEDLDMVASSDGGSADAMEMLQNDLDFYDFADKAASGPAA